MNTTENFEMCDEEKSYHDWVAKNLIFVNANKNSVSVMKKLYLEGFAAGYQYRKEFNSKEWLQK